jgi:hypothetical protein
MNLPDITLDWTFKLSDLAVVAASFIGPFAAVFAAEWLRDRSDQRTRRVHIFRTLMATRSTPASQYHVEAINLIEVEFSTEPPVIAAWWAYRAHLDTDTSLPSPEQWGKSREDKHHELLYTISAVLKYPFQKSDLKRGTYYPRVLNAADEENTAIRKQWLRILYGGASLPMSANVIINQPVTQIAEPPAKPK